LFPESKAAQSRQGSGQRPHILGGVINPRDEGDMGEGTAPALSVKSILK